MRLTLYRSVLAITLAGLFVTMNAHSASDKILFDFTAATNSAAWQIVNDDVMGGVSSSTFRLTNGAALFSGDVSLENNGGFASVRSQPARHDLRGSESFVIRVRGDGRRYKFTVRTDASFDAPIYQCVLATRVGEWQEHRFAFKDFVPTFRGRVLADASLLDPARVTSVGFLISDKQAGPFRLEIASVKATRVASAAPCLYP